MMEMGDFLTRSDVPDACITIEATRSEVTSVPTEICVPGPRRVNEMLNLAAGRRIPDMGDVSAGTSEVPAVAAKFDSYDFGIVRETPSLPRLGRLPGADCLIAACRNKLR